MEKERPEAPAQSAPPVGGREDGTSKGSVRETQYDRGVQTQDLIRLRNANAGGRLATGVEAPGSIGAHARIEWNVGSDS